MTYCVTSSVHLASPAVGMEDVEGEVVEAARDAHPARHRRVLLHRHRPAQHPAKDVICMKTRVHGIQTLEGTSKDFQWVHP